MSAETAPMLIVEISRIPPEGLDLDSELTPGEVHIEGEDTFELMSGGRLRARVEKGDENSVHVRGRLNARLRLQCGRCLESFTFPLDQELDLFYLPQSSAPQPEEEEEVELADRDMVIAFYRGDRLDLGEMVREQLFLSLPMKRLCREGCAGLCPSCGANRNLTPCECTVEDLDQDPRLAPLKDLFGKGSS